VRREHREVAACPEVSSYVTVFAGEYSLMVYATEREREREREGGREGVFSVGLCKLKVVAASVREYYKYASRVLS